MAGIFQPRHYSAEARWIGMAARMRDEMDRSGLRIADLRSPIAVQRSEICNLKSKICNLTWGLIAPVLLTLCGCTTPRDYVANGFKVGPNYQRPPAPVAKDWIDAADKRVRKDTDDLSKWWTVFNDPVLDGLICFAYNQNLTLRQAGYRVLEARAQLGIARGNFFPQLQDARGDWSRNVTSRELANRTLGERYFSQFDLNFNVAWELDFWGRFRRAIEAAVDTLDASVENYDDVLVTLLGDVATNYVQMRTFEQRILYAKDNVDIQRRTLKIAEAKNKGGIVPGLDVDQAQSLLAQTQAQIPELEINLRQSINQLCILLGIPPEDLRVKLGPSPKVLIPTAPTEVVVGVPADLLRRRPDVRRAERKAAAQSAQIGVAEADFYPHISIVGTIGYSASDFKNLFTSNGGAATVGPSFQWNILNYGRILNNVRLQDATFNELVTVYQNTVLQANQDVENGLVTFLRGQERTAYQKESVEWAEKATKVVIAQYEAGAVDYTRVTLIQQNLVQQQDTLAQAQGEIALGLITVYRALGGGWPIRVNGCDPKGLRLQEETRSADMPAQNPPPAAVPLKDTFRPLPAGIQPRAVLSTPGVE
jgi:NodT family efflux transporter outer membrane factor (OMF) lipoprotein